MIVSIRLPDPDDCAGCPLLGAEGCRIGYKAKQVKTVGNRIVLPRPKECVKGQGR